MSRTWRPPPLADDPDNRRVRHSFTDPDVPQDYLGGGRECHGSGGFAQLITRGQNHGVHCIIVPIRMRTVTTCPV